MVIGANDLTLEGRGDWIEGPEENVMLSTAIIICTSGIGGFAFFASTSITIRGLTFLTCGTRIYNSTYMSRPVYAVMFVMNVFQFEFHQNSMQESKVEYTLVVDICYKVQVTNSSFFHTNHSQYLNPSSAAINCTYGRGGISHTTVFAKIDKLEVSNSNFTKSCSEDMCKQCFGPILSDKIDTAIFTRLTLFKFQARSAGIIVQQPILVAITKSIFKQGKGAGIRVIAKSSPGYFITIQEIQILNTTFQQSLTAFQKSLNTTFQQNTFYQQSQDALVMIKCNPELQLSINNVVQIFDSQILQTANDLHAHSYIGSGIKIDGCQYVEIENLDVQLQHLNTGLYINSRFHSWFLIPRPAVETHFTMNNSSFTMSRHMQSVVLFRNVAGNITNSNFSDNFNGLSAVTVTASSVTFINCSISNNKNMTGLTVTNHGFVLFVGHNVIQNNSASEGAGIKLFLTSRVRVIGILRIYDNTANEGVGGGIFHLLLNKLHTIMPSITDNTICNILIDSHGSIYFSGNRAVKGGSDTYGLTLFECFDEFSHLTTHISIFPE